MKSVNKRMNLVPVLAAPAIALLLAFSGCKKEEAAKPVVAEVHAPASQTDDAGWKAFYQAAINKNAQGVDGTISPYYLPTPGTPDYDDKYMRQLQGVQDVVSRGVLPGNLIAFMSPDSTKMPDLVVAAFSKASAGSMKKVIVLFVGKPADNDRVKAAVEPSGATYRFAEFK